MLMISYLEFNVLSNVYTFICDYSLGCTQVIVNINIYFLLDARLENASTQITFWIYHIHKTRRSVCLVNGALIRLKTAFNFPYEFEVTV